MTRKLSILATASLLAATLAQPLIAHAADGTIVHLRTSVQKELPNDEVNASLFIQDQHAQASVLADKLNKLLNRAGSELKAFPAIKQEQGQYQSWPVYDKNGKIQSWSGRASIQLQSRDFTAMANAIAQLQKYLLLENIQFGVADETRKAAETALIPLAIADLKSQAQATAKALSRQQIDFQELTLGDARPESPPIMYRAKAAMAVGEAADVATPQWQSGSSSISLTINGRVLLH